MLITDNKAKLAFIKQCKKEGLELVKVTIDPSAVHVPRDFGDVYLDISRLKGNKRILWIPYCHYLVDNNWNHLALVFQYSLESLVSLFPCVYDEKVQSMSKEEAESLYSKISKVKGLNK